MKVALPSFVGCSKDGREPQRCPYCLSPYIETTGVSIFGSYPAISCYDCGGTFFTPAQTGRTNGRKVGPMPPEYPSKDTD